MRFSDGALSLLITSWVGSLWTVGYLVAPTLFMTLPDRTLAGMIAGKLFRVEAWLSLGAGALVLLLLYLTRRRQQSPHWPPHRAAMLKITCGMVSCTVLGYFALQPSMAALREITVGTVMQAENKTRFALLHGAASAVYLIQSLLGLLLVLKNASAMAGFSGESPALEVTSIK